MSLLIAGRERGTLAWVASKPVSRSAIWLSKWAAGATVITIVAGIVPMAATFAVVAVLYGSAGIGVFLLTAFGIAASVAFIVAVVLAASTVLSNQAAVAAIGFAVLFVPQILVGVLPVDLGPFLPTSIMSWAIGMAGGADVGVVTPVAWLVSVVAVAAFASWRMERLEF
jgi:ABC-type transport system involved in multi-copper enzyme maturation permease subunit